MSKSITVESVVEVQKVPTDKGIIYSGFDGVYKVPVDKDLDENSKAFQLEREKHPEFWKEFHCVVLSRVQTHPSLVQNKTTRQYGLGYPTSGHVCYAANSFCAHQIWVMHYSHSYENCLICPICDEDPFI